MATGSNLISLIESPRAPSVVRDIVSGGKIGKPAEKVNMIMSSNNLISERENDGIYLDIAFLHDFDSSTIGDEQDKKIEINNRLDIVYLSIKQYIDSLIGVGIRLTGINHILLDTLMNGGWDDVLIISKSNPSGIKIATGKESYDPRVIGFLYGGILSFQGTNEMYSGRIESGQECKNLIIHWSESDLFNAERMMGAQKVREYPMNFDGFFSYVWSKGITFGIHYKEIGAFFEKNTIRSMFPKGSLLIASPKKPKEGSDDRIEYKLKVKPEVRPSEVDGRLDHKISKYNFPQAKKGELIIVLYKGKVGEDGRDIEGNPIAHIPGTIRIELLKDQLPQSKSSKITYSYILDEGMKYVQLIPGKSPSSEIIFELYALEDIFISTAEGHLILAKETVNKKHIGVTGTEIRQCTGTGIIVTNKETLFRQEGNIQSGYPLIGWSLFISKAIEELAGKIIAEKDIEIYGSNVVGADITSKYGNIIIDRTSRIHGHSVIHAINGKVTLLGNIENTIINANEIEVHGIAKNCILLGKRITLGGSHTNTIAGESISVKIEKGNSNYIILLFYTIIKHLKGLEQKIDDTKKKILELERSAQESPNIQKQLLDLRGFLKKDIFVQGKMQGTNKDYISGFQGRCLSISSIKDSSYEGSVLALPITFILDDALYRTINPLISVEDRHVKKEKELTDILNRIRCHMPEISTKGISLLGGQTHIGTFEAMYDTVVPLIDAHMNAAMVANTLGINGRIDTHREVLLSKEESGILMSGGSLGKGRLPIIRVSVNGDDGCFLYDISESGSSFLVPKEMIHLQKDVGVGISYSLPGIGHDDVLVSNFRIIRTEEFQNYIKISGDYIDDGLQNKIRLFLNYLAKQKNKN